MICAESTGSARWLYARRFIGAASIASLMPALRALLSFVVASRTQEFGVRIALGARPEDLVKSVFRQALLWVGMGAIAGVALAAITAQYLSSMVYGIRPADPLSLCLSVIVILAAALTAACIPAWRATRIDPLVALQKLS